MSSQKTQNQTAKLFELQEDEYLSLSELHNVPDNEYFSRVKNGLIAVCKQGEAIIEVNLTPLKVVRNTQILLFPNQIIRQTSASPDFQLNIISYSSEFINDIFLHTPTEFVSFINQHCTYQMSEYESEIFYREFFDVFKRRQQLSDTLTHKEAIRNLLRIFFLDILSGVLRDENLNLEPKSRKYELLESFYNLVIINYKENRTVAYYADKLFVTSKYLSRISRELDVKHRSAKEWIDDYSITEIKLLLKSTTLSVQSISEQLNFPNLSFFSKFFKSRTGITPTQYRTEHS